MSLFLASVRAQEAQFRQEEEQKPPLPTIQEEEIVVPAGSEELGVQRILRRVPSPSWLKFTSDSQFSYDSNIFLSHNDPNGAGVFAERLGVEISPPWFQKPRLTLFDREDIVRFTSHRELDFNAQTVGFSLSYPLPKDFSIYGGFSGEWLESRAGGHQFYRETDTRLGAAYSRLVGKRAAILAGLQFDYHDAQPSLFDRLDYEFYAGGRVALTRRLMAEMYYRLQYEDFTPAARQDVRNVLGGGLVCRITKYVSLRAFVNHTSNSSSLDTRDYSVLNAGGDLVLSLKF